MVSLHECTNTVGRKSVTIIRESVAGAVGMHVLVDQSPFGFV